MAKFDFSGYATKNNIKCSDGRVIKKDAFKSCDGITVPLVWAHNHDDPEYVLGHAVLENRDDGVYTYGCFNDTPKGQLVKEMVRHGDITKLSIYANQLKQMGSDVIHGVIREVSLVQAGANPGAVIENLCFSHSDGSVYDSEEDAIIYTDDSEKLELYHADSSEEKKEEPKTEEKKDEDEKMPESGKTIGDVIKTMNDEQKKVLFGLIGAIAAKKGINKVDLEENMKHSEFDNEGEDVMKYNVFDSQGKASGSAKRSFSHSEEMKIMKDIIEDAKSFGSLKKAVQFHITDGAIAHSEFIAHDDEEAYGIEDIDWLFPEYKNLDTEPRFISRDQKWVEVFMNGTKKTPFSRVKSMFADITADEARAKGYIKGDKKLSEVFTLIRRTTDPQTIYKLNKLDRDDILDITSFDVVRYMKAEMKVMIKEEIARAALIGDGKDPSDRTHISHDHVRPISEDDSFYTIPVTFSGATEQEECENFIRNIILARVGYKGSGSITMYIKADRLAKLLLMKDGVGRDLYEDEAKLAKKLRIKEIVECPVLDGSDYDAILVDMKDYNFGNDKGGELTLFDDFDIDFNQEKYLIETRLSGALVLPYSAMAVKKVPVNPSQG